MSRPWEFRFNPPQGGGFDLSVFPQFIWAAYQYQPGPALGTFDPRGTSGSLTLLPWTSQSLNSGVQGGRLPLLRRLPISIKSPRPAVMVTRLRRSWATAAAMRRVRAEPSAGIRSLSERQTLSFHLLLTDIDAKTPGPANLTPYAHQLTVRGIPFFSWILNWGPTDLLKSSVFFDGSYLRYDDSHRFPACRRPKIMFRSWALRTPCYGMIGSSASGCEGSRTRRSDSETNRRQYLICWCRNPLSWGAMGAC